jgi:diguanylate cyclase (GGDEF)-like protein
MQLSESAIVGRTDDEFFSSDQAALHHQNDRRVMATGETIRNKSWVTREDGRKALMETSKSPYYNQNGEIAGVVGVSSDITHHWIYEHKLLEVQEELRKQKNSFEHDAHYDALTNLPNRVLFHDRLGQSIAKAKRNHDGLAVFFLDLDHFKQINDTLGHDIGDKVLQEAAKRLTGCVREMDTIARLGGDEFTVLLESMKQPHNAAVIARKINEVMEQPIVVDDHELHISTSIGIALYPENGETIEALVKCADVAMYQVKEGGRNAFAFVSE